MRLAAAALIAVAAVASRVAVRPWDAQRADEFGYSPDGAPERATRAGLRPGEGPHVHPKLNVVVRSGGGERVRMWVKAPAQRTFKEITPRRLRQHVLCLFREADEVAGAMPLRPPITYRHAPAPPIGLTT